MPLKGIRVLELAGLAPGPFCGMVLSDFGASVIRVDKTSNAASIDVLSNGKRSIALNLKNSRGIEIFRKMSDQSDVLIDPFRKGVMEKLHLGPDDLMNTNKRLIYARLTGFGQDGPYANMAGHDINFLSLSGLLSLFGRFNEKPIPPANVVADFGGGGLTCALGIILALYERNKTNVGQVIDASMVDGTAYLGSWLFRSRKIPGLWDNPHGKNLLDTGAHFYDTYETKDKRYMAVGALEPQFYAIFLEKLGLSLEDVPQFENFEENRTKIAEIFKEKTQEEWCTVFDGTDACVTPVLSVTDAPFHIHNSVRGTFKASNNEIIPNPAPRLSRSPGISTAMRKAPKHGEHTLDILSELKYTPKEIANFISDGTVVAATNSNL